MKAFLVALLFTTYPFAYGDSVYGRESVNTTYGPVQGKETDDLIVFINIPFAKPPVGELRFASPELPNSWNETLNVSDLDASAWCIQNEIWTTIDNVDEDCLYLNIYTPSGNSSEPWPVMVWIHGGGFVAGSKDQYDARHFMKQNKSVIIVTINYRLGIFGFLYDNSTGVEGNFGFEDQMMAIRWVHDNIEYFGGDKSNINIFGESAGANSVALHLLYNNTFIESGIMQSPALWVLHNEPEDNQAPTDQFSAAMSCNSTTLTAAERLECWRSVNVSNVIEYWNQTAGTNLLTAFAPTIGTDLLPKHPMRAIAEWEDPDVPSFIIGTTKDEAWFFLDESLVGGPLDSYGGALGYASAAVQWHNLTVTAAVFDHYNITEDQSSSANYIYDVINIMSDVWHCHVHWLLSNLTGNVTQNAWYYNLDVVDEDANELFWGDSMSQCWSRTCHFVDIYYLFMTNASAQSVSDGTVSLSHSMREYWINFASNHNPNEVISVAAAWSAVENDTLLRFGSYDNISATDMDRRSVCAVFDSIGYVPPFSMPNGWSADTETEEEEEEGDGSEAVSIVLIYAICFTANLFF